MLLNASLSSSNTGLEEAWSPLAPFVKDLDCCSTACVSVYAKKTQNHLATMKFRLTAKGPAQLSVISQPDNKTEYNEILSLIISRDVGYSVQG
jgi:hypothetical protein